MPEQIMGTVGSFVADVRFNAGSNAIYVFDTAGTSGTTNVLGSVEISNPQDISGGGGGSVVYIISGHNLLGSFAASNLLNPMPIIGSVAISNATINVDVTVGDYVSIVGSPSYSLPVVGSMAVSNYNGSVHIQNVPSILGSVQVSSIVGPLPAGTALIGSIHGIKESLPVGANVLGSALVKITSDGTAMLGSVKIGAIPVGTNIIGSVAVDIQKVGLNVPVVGSVQLSGYTGLIGSVKATPDGYYSILGSPSYSLPVIGSVAISNTISVATGSGMVLYSGDITNIAKISNGNLSVIGSVAVTSSIVSTTSFDSVGGEDTMNMPASGLAIGGIDSATGSYAFARVTSNRLDVNATTSISFEPIAAPDTKNLPGSGMLIGGKHPTTGSMAFAYVSAANRFMTDVLGSVQLQAGTLKVGSICGISESLPVGGNLIGSICGIKESLPVGANVLGSVLAKITSDGTAMLGSVKIGAIPLGTNIIGSVAVDIQKVGINVPVVGSVQLSGYTGLIGSVKATPDGYYSILGSPSYSLPIIGSVAISNTISVATGSGMVLYSGDITNIADITSGRLATQNIGSVQVSSIVGALPAGTALIGSIHGIKESLPVGANVLGSALVRITGDGTAAIGKLSAGTALIGSVVAQISADGTAMLGSVKIGTIPVGTNIIGSVAADIQKFGVALPAGTATIGSVGLQGPWTGIGSVTTYENKVGSFVSNEWTAANFAGSFMWAAGTDNRIWITDVTCSVQGSGITTLYFNANGPSNYITKAFLVANGGFVNNYSKPLAGPVNGSIFVNSTSISGCIIVNGYAMAG